MRKLRRDAFVGTALLLAACSEKALPDPGPSDDPNDYQVDTSVQYDVSFSPVQWIVPSAALPARIQAGDLPSNNNCDIIFFDHRLFVAFRTSETHFASPNSIMFLMSSADDGKTWDFEDEITMGTDVREPRFLVFNHRLLFHWFEAGAELTTFTPIAMWRKERNALGQWTTAEKWGRQGEVPWEMKVRGGKAYMTSYAGNHYSASEGAVDVFFQSSTDGLTWAPTNPARPVVNKGGNSEVAWELAADGTLWTVLRNEDGDSTGFGAQVCWAPPSDLSDWKCLDRSLPYRYDSPKMFRHGDDLFLVARRDLNPDGTTAKFDEGLTELSFDDQKTRYLIDYWNRPKRTTLYRLDTATKVPVPVLDFPSSGDTAFPAIRRTGPHTWLMINYTSPPDKPNLTWLEGQTADFGTQLYLTTITFTPKQAAP